MEDLVLAAFALALLGILVGTPALCVIVLVRIRRLERRVSEFEAAAAPEPVPDPEPVHTPPAAPEVPRALEPAVTEEAQEEVAAPVAPVAPVAPAAPAAPLPLPRPSPRAQKASFEWERWLGIRGAALLGGIILALAGLLFFQYSVQRGWITPALRVTIGVVFGLAALGFSRPLYARGYGVTSNALAGAGAVILYGAVWAANTLYGLLPAAVSLAAMVLVTTVCGALALRRKSLAIALFGLVGGFATPLLLSIGSEGPLGLFCYLLLLDLGLLVVGRRAGWPLVAALGAAGSFAVGGFWTVLHLSADDVLVTLVFLGVSSIVFATSGKGRGWLAGQSTALFLPIPFVLYFAVRVELRTPLVPLAVMMAALLVVSGWIARRESAPWLAVAASAGTVGTLLVWVLSAPAEHTSLHWTLMAVCLGLAATVHAGVELGARRGPGTAGAAGAHGALVLDLGLMAVLTLAALETSPALPWPLVASSALLVQLIARLGVLRRRAPIQLAGAAAMMLGWIAWRHAAGDVRAELSAAAEIALRLALVAVLLVPAALQRSRGHVWAVRAVCLGALALAFDLIALWWPSEPQWHLAGIAALVLVALVTAAAGRSTLGFAGAALAWVGALTVWTTAYLAAGLAPAALSLVGAAVLGAIVLAPVLTADRLRSAPASLVAALATLAAYFSLQTAFGGTGLAETLSRLGGTGLSPLPLALAGLSAFAARRADEVACATFATVAVVLLAFALPIEIGREVPTVGAAGTLVGLAWLARHRRHGRVRILAPALVVILCVLTIASVVRLVSSPGLLPRSGWPLIHWVGYVFGLSALAALIAARLLDGRSAKAAGAVGIALTFLWLNLEVVNLFSTGERLDLDLARQAGRDLATSVAWAAFAFVLLGVGVRRAAPGLRWASLAFLMAATFKVFLYDLGELEGLFRVGSLIGLATALLAVSLVYQRFVFARTRSSPAET